MSDSAQKTVQDALGAYLAEGEIVVAWTVTLEVMSPKHGRFLAHRVGGGMDGADSPTDWALYGMRGAAYEISKERMRLGTRPVEHPDDMEEGDSE